MEENWKLIYALLSMVAWSSVLTAFVHCYVTVLWWKNIMKFVLERSNSWCKMKEMKNWKNFTWKWRRIFIFECYFSEVVKHNDFIALSSNMTGNCLYSSVSLSLFGDNSVCNMLHIMTCIELFLNAKFYSSHPFFFSVWEKNKDNFLNMMSVFSCCVSDCF